MSPDSLSASLLGEDVSLTVVSVFPLVKEVASTVVSVSTSLPDEEVASIVVSASTSLPDEDVASIV